MSFLKSGEWESRRTMASESTGIDNSSRSSRLRFSRRRSSVQQKQKPSRMQVLQQEVFSHALCYMLVFWMTWPVVVAGMLLPTKPYWFLVLTGTLAPTQGILNAINYFRPQIIRWRKLRRRRLEAAAKGDGSGQQDRSEGVPRGYITWLHVLRNWMKGSSSSGTVRSSTPNGSQFTPNVSQITPPISRVSNPPPIDDDEEEEEQQTQEDEVIEEQGQRGNQVEQEEDLYELYDLYNSDPNFDIAADDVLVGRNGGNASSGMDSVAASKQSAKSSRGSRAEFQLVRSEERSGSLHLLVENEPPQCSMGSLELDTESDRVFDDCTSVD